MLLLTDGMTNIQSEQTPSWNPEIGLRQVIRADNGELATGPSAAKVGRTVDGSPTEVPGTVMVGGMQWLATGEFLVEETFDKYRKEGGLFYGHWSDEQEACLDVAMAHPLVMIASDGIPFVDGKAHPRGAGTFCRFLGLYCREKGCVDLPNAIRYASFRCWYVLQYQQSDTPYRIVTNVGG